MREYEWHASRSPGAMVRCVRHRHAPGCDRQLRHFALNCCRLAWPALTAEASRSAVEAAELYMAGLAPRDQFLAALADATTAATVAQGACVRACGAAAQTAIEALALRTSAALAARLVVWVCTHGYYEGLLAHVRDALAFLGVVRGQSAVLALRGQLCALVRETCGNPFRPVAVAPGWRTDTALALALGVYKTRDFGAMPILADALQDAGCYDAPLLSHCRDATLGHVRGCWALDLLLGDGWTDPLRAYNTYQIPFHTGGR
ncbi:MAG: hypothetical protein ACKODX_19360 [Gemmata sp.]